MEHEVRAQTLAFGRDFRCRVSGGFRRNGDAFARQVGREALSAGLDASGPRFRGAGRGLCGRLLEGLHLEGRVGFRTGVLAQVARTRRLRRAEEQEHVAVDLFG